LFLDEIGDMQPALQGKLLRVLQDHEVRPVGGTEGVKIDVRIVAASNQDLAQGMESGQFRKDLFYRLNVIPIRVPPLRERVEDIPALAEAFLRKHAVDGRHRFTEQVLRKLSRATWPGNARELENCVERALALVESDEIRTSDILLSTDEGQCGDGSLQDMLARMALERRVTLKELSDAYVDAALEAAHGRKSEAAELLNVNRRTLYRREERRMRAANETQDD
jgi:DNA-binding NtrC family response regulator